MPRQLMTASINWRPCSQSRLRYAACCSETRRVRVWHTTSQRNSTMRNLNEHNITDEAVRRFTSTPSDPRLQTIMASLLTHLHAFAREVNLTEEEWFEGIQFLTRVGQKCDDKRQEFILLSDTLGLSQLVVAQNHKRPPGVTEQTVFGPFHVPGAPHLAPGS